MFNPRPRPALNIIYTFVKWSCTADERIIAAGESSALQQTFVMISNIDHGRYCVSAPTPAASAVACTSAKCVLSVELKTFVGNPHKNNVAAINAFIGRSLSLAARSRPVESRAHDTSKFKLRPRVSPSAAISRGKRESAAIGAQGARRRKADSARTDCDGGACGATRTAFIGDHWKLKFVLMTARPDSTSEECCGRLVD
ncbi:hypothetical protein EVAR_23678_1 [Eumeta japonica]|uniref:Uncharacterized protein n=1 Tax=Eumeta variegata TaxID=151549 RepID=A0A4C1VJA0_EUMVA|nr:hypothetical protein EVAR_23678_1 [Eumeta japonica]